MRFAFAIFLATTLAIPAAIAAGTSGPGTAKVTDFSSAAKKKKKSSGNTTTTPPSTQGGTPSDNNKSTY